MSFYFYRQHDAMQCGIACMAMVCKYYGRIRYNSFHQHIDKV
ncbi:cysteine peptidase family C39 domain-containing protein [Prevotella denticola]|nr:cysteine peptidase family C39 domain-containing protein [Prevotella denticola]